MRRNRKYLISIVGVSVFAMLALFTVGCELVAAQEPERAGPEWQRHEGMRPSSRGGEFERENVELPAGLAVTVQLERESARGSSVPATHFECAFSSLWSRTGI